jgi:3-oxoadipate enol-lactonase
VSLRVALRDPGRVRGLILLDTQAGTEDPDVIPLYESMLDEWVTKGPSDEIADVVAGLIIGEPTLMEEWVPRWRARPHESLAMPGRALIARDDITDRLGEIDVPALVAIEGGTHSANLTHPGPVNEAVLAFVEGLPV